MFPLCYFFLENQEINSKRGSGWLKLPSLVVNLGIKSSLLTVLCIFSLKSASGGAFKVTCDSLPLMFFLPQTRLKIALKKKKAEISK